MSIAERQVDPDLDVILAVRGVTLNFAGIRALDGVELEVRNNELFAVIGPNGAGKTSLLNVISGLYRPQAGAIEFKRQPLVGLPSHQIARRGLARMFQNIELFEHLTLIENLLVGRERHVTYGTWASLAFGRRVREEEVRHRAKVEDIVDLLEIEAFRDTPAGLLPYGVQKRVELGRALAAEPDLLLLDEPVAGMNREETEDMARFLLVVREELQVPMILVEHDMGLVMDLADRVMVLDFGRVVTTGSPEDVQQHPEVREAYLGVGH
ncbi:ABC transporter ATP-binding protein [Nitriliruptor alkaliphilus]|uniref:ABC transporter ATP-binding protein n=1 Tax=Nitriliruptor alkaliphilus TaxID=427918 RepID=UPI000695C279|nr:ABC transporter ATP-binding protein [Nitriliruptor alkaliphilus]